MPRRANGQGSISRNKTTGEYTVWITLPDGRRRKRRPKAQTRAGAEALKAELLGESKLGPDATLAEYAPFWLESKRVKGLSSRSLETYEERLELNILPHLGRMCLRAIAPRDLERCYAAMVDRGLSPKTIRMVHEIVFGLLKSARRQRPPLVTENVAELVEIPAGDQYAGTVLTVPQLRTLLAAVAGHRHGALWTFLLATGCRFGEAAGLPWSTVDLDDGSAGLEQVAVRVKTVEGWRIVLRRKPKTKAGHRVVPLPGWCVAALRKQRSELATRRLRSATWENRDLVFPNDRGGPLAEAHVNERWHVMLKAAGLPRTRMHDLRHALATHVLDHELGDLLGVSRLLGHANVGVTSGIYTGKVPRRMRRTADAYGDLIAPPGPSQDEKKVGC